MNWGENILKIADLYKQELYKSEDAEVYLKTFCNSEIRVSILILAYDTLVNTKRIEAIESLPIEEKRKLWEEAKRLCDNDNKQYLIRVSKALFTLGQYIQI